ncbi:hypothetical protein KKG71_04925 [Patescibacteria group bacterium]|nr:hypothetical protein [Patescibacteria group bacterium]
MKVLNYALGFASATAVMAMIALATTSAFAQSAGAGLKQGNNYSTERHEDMMEAFETNDYAAWSKLMSGKNARVLDVITEENFGRFVEAKKLMDEGKIEEAKAIKEELGLKGFGPRQNMGKRGAYMKGMKKGFNMGKNFDPAHHEAMMAAFEAGDYAAWRELMTEDGKNPKILEMINEDNFGGLVAAKQLLKDGKVQEAKAAFKELGLEGFGKGMGDKGMHKGFAKGMKKGFLKKEIE